MNKVPISAVCLPCRSSLGEEGSLKKKKKRAGLIRNPEDVTNSQQ